LIFTYIAASNTASDDVTNQFTNRIFNTDLIESCAHFTVKLDEKFSLNDGFKYDIMSILDSGLLFWLPCIIYSSRNDSRKITHIHTWTTHKIL